MSGDGQAVALRRLSGRQVSTRPAVLAWFLWSSLTLPQHAIQCQGTNTVNELRCLVCVPQSWVLFGTTQVCVSTFIHLSNKQHLQGNSGCCCPLWPACGSRLGLFYLLFYLLCQDTFPGAGLFAATISSTSTFTRAQPSASSPAVLQLPPSAELLAAAQDVVEQWAAVAQHPGLVCPRQAFVSQELEFAPCLVFAHDYQPAAYTLEQAHMHPHTTNAGGVLLH